MPVRPAEHPLTELRVLHLVSGDLWAGAEVQVYQLLRAAGRLPGLEVHAVVMNPGLLAERLAAEGIEVTVLDESRQSFFSLARKLISLARSWRPAVIHTHRRKEHLLGAMTANTCGAALLATVHGRGEFAHSRFNLRQRVLHGAEQLVLTRVHDKLIAVSDDLADDLPGPARRKVIIPNGIDVEAVRAAAGHPAPAPGPAGRRRIGFLGRLVPVKQVDRMLEMMALLERESPGRYALHIVGDGPLRGALEQLKARLELGHAVTFHGFTENPLPLLATMDLFLFASAHEGLPMTALESLALGVPIVSPLIDSLARLIGESGAGRVAASSAPRDLADAVLNTPIRDHEGPGLRPSLLPQRYHVEQGLGATLRLWRELAARKAS